VTDTLERQQLGNSAISEYRVRAGLDRRELEAIFSEDRPLAAYALGHLERDLFEGASFYIADGPAGSAVVMHAGGMGLATITLGAPEAVGAILSIHPGPRRSYLSTAAPEQMPLLRGIYRLTDELPMRRMSITRDRFTAKSGETRRLTGNDVGRLNNLYASEGGPSFYRPDTIARAVYFGIFDGPRLVSVAGSHIVAPNTSIAVVGNVFTDAAYRGSGLATITSSAVTEALLARGCADIVLTVDPANTPAVHAYRRLGYEFGSNVVEARIHRKDILGIGPALRRRAAQRRGQYEKPAGTEIILRSLHREQGS
jgi:ribosomal protein S18 acetylase RimI-like enzyme